MSVARLASMATVLRQGKLVLSSAFLAVWLLCQLFVAAQPPFFEPGVDRNKPLPQFPASPAPRPVAAEAPNRLVVDVVIQGNETVNADQIIADLETRPQRVFDPVVVQADKRRLISTGRFREVSIFLQNVPDGVVVTFKVFERPTIRYVRFLGDRGIREKTLLRESGLEVGEALNLYAIQEGRRKLEDFYRSKGFPKATVVIAEGQKPEHRGVVFEVSEGPLQRIAKVEFIGNSFASSQLLKTKIQSKPGILGYFLRGKVDLSKIAEDKDRLIEYYRALGFFDARIGHRGIFSDDNQNWMTLRYVIDEGPRYVVNRVSIVGNQRFELTSLTEQLSLKTGDYFNLAKMTQDESQLRDLYGGFGHIFANVTANPLFLYDSPGRLDLVYNVEEGKQFRVGRINIHIAGEDPHTRESVIRDRLSIRTGDIVDIREVRASERRLKASQLFEDQPASGKTPRVVIRPPQLSDADGFLSEGHSAVRGQSPDMESDEVVLDVYLPPGKTP